MSKRQRRILLPGITAAAREAGVTHSHLSRVLRGERKPGKELAKKIARLALAMNISN